jgi:hypothetical protein
VSPALLKKVNRSGEVIRVLECVTGIAARSLLEPKDKGERPLNAWQRLLSKGDGD